MRRVIVIGLVVAVAVVFLHDAGRWVNTQARLNEATTQLAEWASTNLRVQNPAEAPPIVAGEGAKRGVTVYRFEQDQTTVRVWTSANVVGTWVVGPYMAVNRGTPLRQSIGAPFVVRSYRQEQIQ